MKLDKEKVLCTELKIFTKNNNLTIVGENTSLHFCIVIEEPGEGGGLGLVVENLQESRELPDTRRPICWY